jgi:enoyl-CoA hydratase/carnithine racemase
VLQVRDQGRVRTLTLDRPEALNAFNEALYDATAEALMEAAASPGVAVVIVTGNGRAFSAGTDVLEMAVRASAPDRAANGVHGFPGFIDQLASFPKPLFCAVNGLALGIGATMLGYADLVFMSTDARLRCPFTDLAVAPEAASSYLFPLLLGRQQATWFLMSSEWFTAEQCASMGLAWRLTRPEDLLAETRAAAQLLASKSLASLIETKRTIIAAHRGLIAAARSREDTAFKRLLGQPANREAFSALAERRAPAFAEVDAINPVDVEAHRVD